MNIEITQENVHIFFPYKISNVAYEISKKENISIGEAVEKFYQSKTAKLLEDESTKLWQLGWVYLYETYCEEINDRAR